MQACARSASTVVYFLLFLPEMLSTLGLVLSLNSATFPPSSPRSCLSSSTARFIHSLGYAPSRSSRQAVIFRHCREMERPSFLTRSKSNSFSSVLSAGDEKYSLLALPAHQQPKLQVRALLGHCLYRRVILWTVTILFVVCLTLSTRGVRQRHGTILDFVDFRQGGTDNNSSGEEAPALAAQGNSEDSSQDEQNRQTWLRFKQ